MDNKQFLKEMFNIETAKGYDFDITDMSTVTIPEIKFQATFTADNGVEYAFRAYRADSMPGRKYGPHARLLTFMRKKSRNFSQNITIDMGTFKKVVVTFMRCYAAYKESKDGQKSSSYAVVMPDSIRPYATLFVRATKRAFRNQKRVHLSLVGVNEQGKGNTIELMYVNPQSMFPYFGGKDYDTSKFVGNPTHVDLAKVEGKEVELKAPADNQAAAVAPANAVSPLDTSHVAAVQPTKDRFNPDNIPGLNDPAVFNDPAFIHMAFSADGRDALEAVFKKYKIHRRYFAHRIKEAIALWEQQFMPTDYMARKVSGLIDGVGFYINRHVPEYMTKFVTKILEDNVLISSEELAGLIDTYKVGEITDRVAERLTLKFVRDHLSPISGSTAAAFEILSKVLTATGRKTEDIDMDFLKAYITDRTDLFIAAVSMNWMDTTSIRTSEIEIEFAGSVSGKIEFAQDVYEKIRSTLTGAGMGSRVAYSKVEAQPANSNFIDLKNAMNNVSLIGIVDAMRNYKLDQRGPDSLAVLVDVKKSIDSSVSPSSAIKSWELYKRSGYSTSTGVLNLLDIAITAAEVSSGEISEEIIFSVIAYGETDLMMRLLKVYVTSSDRLHNLIGLILKHNDVVWRDNGSVIRAAYENGILSTREQVMDAVKFIIDLQERNSYNRGIVDRHINDVLKYAGVLTAEDMLSLFPSQGANPNSVFVRFNAWLQNSNAEEFGKFIDIVFENAPHGPNYTMNELAMRASTAFTSNMNRQVSDDIAEKLSLVYRKMKDTNRDISGAMNANVARVALFGRLDSVMKYLSEDEINAAIYASSHYLKYPFEDGDFDETVPDRFIKTIVDSVYNGTDNVKRKSWNGEISPNEDLAKTLAFFNSSILNKLGDSDVLKLVEMFGNIQATSTTRRVIYQPILDMMSDVLSEADVSKHNGLAQKLLDSIEDRERRLLVKSIGKNLFANRYIREFRDNSAIKMNVDLNHKSISSILNFNNIAMPNLPSLTEKDNIESAKKKIDKVVLAVPEEKVEKVELTPDELTDLTIEYDAFNRKKHNLSLVIQEVFNVSIPSQIEGRKAWDEKMAAEGINSKIMYPVFHGTGSVAAAMILRLGFAVSSIKDTAKTGVKTAGRMLGDGIYFSTAIDKVAQYASDGGFGRRLGDEGYIFEMNASLGKHWRDFREAGTNTSYSERNVISPEWAVFNPNEQLVIKKAYKIKRVPHHVLAKIKKSRNLVNESKNVTAIRGFRDVIRENLDYGNDNMVTFIFSDDRIPLADGTMIEFGDYNGELGTNARVEGGQLGTMVTFINVPDSYVAENAVDIYHIDLTGPFVNGDPLFEGTYKALASRV